MPRHIIVVPGSSIEASLFREMLAEAEPSHSLIHDYTGNGINRWSDSEQQLLILGGDYFLYPSVRYQHSDFRRNFLSWQKDCCIWVLLGTPLNEIIRYVGRLHYVPLPATSVPQELQQA